MLNSLMRETNCLLTSLAGMRLLGWGARIKVKPLQLDSVVEFWLCGDVNLASFGRSRVFGLVLSLLVETWDNGNHLNHNGLGK